MPCKHVFCPRSPKNNARVGRSVCAQTGVRSVGQEQQVCRVDVVVYNWQQQRSRPGIVTGVVGRRMDEGSAKQQANHGRL